MRESQLITLRSGGLRLLGRSPRRSSHRFFRRDFALLIDPPGGGLGYQDIGASWVQALVAERLADFVRRLRRWVSISSSFSNGISPRGKKHLVELKLFG